MLSVACQVCKRVQTMLGTSSLLQADEAALRKLNPTQVLLQW